MALALGTVTLPVVLFTVQVVAATPFIWISAGVLSGVNLYLFWLRLKALSTTDAALRDVVLIDVNDGKFQWSLDESKVAEYGRHDRLVFAGTLVVGAICILFAAFHYAAGNLASVVLDLGFVVHKVPAWFSATFAALFSAGAVGFVHVRGSLQAPLTAVFRNRARPVLERIRSAVEEATQEIEVVVQSTRQFAADLQINPSRPSDVS